MDNGATNVYLDVKQPVSRPNICENVRKSSSEVQSPKRIPNLICLADSHDELESPGEEPKPP
jgi:hypothetical protein